MLKFLETVWLIISVISAAITTYSLFATGFTMYDTVWFFVIALISLGMFFIRRKQRMSREKDRGENLN